MDRDFDLSEVEQVFYDNYDLLVGKIFPTQDSALATFAGGVYHGTRSLCDFGIGNGKASVAVRNVCPGVEVYGIDLNPDNLRKAKENLRNCTLYERGFFDGPLPVADMAVASLSLHHLPTESRRDDLLKIANHYNLFLNSDIFLSNGMNQEQIVDKILEVSRGNFSDGMLKSLGLDLTVDDAMPLIKAQMMTHDNYMPFEEYQDLFLSNGFNFELLNGQTLSKDFPFYVTRVSKND